jgi:hypothetical protein
VERQKETNSDTNICKKSKNRKFKPHVSNTRHLAFFQNLVNPGFPHDRLTRVKIIHNNINVTKTSSSRHSVPAWNEKRREADGEGEEVSGKGEIDGEQKEATEEEAGGREREGRGRKEGGWVGLRDGEGDEGDGGLSRKCPHPHRFGEL